MKIPGSYRAGNELTILKHAPVHRAIDVISAPEINGVVDDTTGVAESSRHRREVHQFNEVLPLLAGHPEDVERVQETVGVRVKPLKLYEHQNVSLDESFAEVQEFLE